MADKKTFDFSGYATKNDLKCSDGRTILRDAFKHQDGQRVPLVWQHMHNDPTNVLGHAILENREDGVYCYGKFNDTVAGREAKELVAHGDITSLSIYANQLKEQAKRVVHGAIREVSLVLSGANPGAVIENVAIAHGDGSYVDDETEAVIYTGLELTHADGEDDKTVGEIIETLNDDQKTAVYALLAQAIAGEEDDGEDTPDGGTAQHSDDGDMTVSEVFETLTETQKTAVYAMIAHALDDSDPDNITHSDERGDNTMKTNVFDQNNAPAEAVLSHEQKMEILNDAKRFGSLRESFLAHATTYGFDPVDVLFPDARNVNADGPALVNRDDTWVSTLLSEATHTPFSRIKTVTANITADEARAKGYVTGSLKKDEVIPLLKRTTSPTTIYKKQKLDRDDIVDITDFDVVMWLKSEMRGMLNEELARAILVGDGRDMSDEDKINEQCIRPIALDNNNVYVHRSELAKAATTDDIVDEFIRSRKHYKGSGSPTLYTSTDLLTEMLLLKDSLGRRIYNNTQELASVLRVSKIVEVELMNGATRKTAGESVNSILGIVVNMKDYTIGADKGGQVAMFDDFDIDYNQYKYLIETRVSGALTRPKSALIIERKPV